MSQYQLNDWKILVIDDEPDSLEVASMLLTMYGATVYTASNGRKGLEIARDQQPHFIISDLSMPEMGGWEMILKAQDNPATRDIPMIALTAHAMTGDRERAIAAGFHNYLTKPLIPETFIADVMRLVSNIPQLSDLLNTSKVTA